MVVVLQDFFAQTWVSPFRFRTWLGHEFVNFDILESWLLSDLVPWMLLLWVTGLHVDRSLVSLVM